MDRAAVLSGLGCGEEPFAPPCAEVAPAIQPSAAPPAVGAGASARPGRKACSEARHGGGFRLPGGGAGASVVVSVAAAAPAAAATPATMPTQWLPFHRTLPQRSHRQNSWW